MRPLQHLEGQHVLVSSLLETWQHTPEGDTAILLKNVTLTDYETGKQSLAPCLDHCWIWVRPSCWQYLQSMNVVLENRFTLLDEVLLAGVVRRYTRTDGTQDYGLRILNWFPITKEQCRELRKKNQSLTRKYEKGHHIDIKALGAEAMIATGFHLQIEDWRERGYSLKAAKVQNNRRIAALERYLIPQYGADQLAALVDQFMESHGMPNLKRCLDFAS